LVLGCTTPAPRQINEPLAAVLLRLAERDQEARRGALADPMNTNLRGTIQRIDRENREELRRMIGQFGWPGRSLVGEQAAHAAWLVAQHADEDPAFQKQCFQLMESASDSEVSRVDLAFLTDRVLLASGKPQRYGTQFKQVGRRVVPEPMEDVKKVEARRHKIGLPPLAQYARELQEIYANPEGAK
jgi:hypothetical protein